MGDYVKPWRRKFGVATLVLACVLMAGWVRSMEYEEEIDLPWCMYSLNCYSHDCKAMILLMSYEHPSDFGNNQIWRSDHAPWLGLSATDRVFKEFGFVSGDPSGYFRRGNVRCAGLIAPYWSIVIPLTLISAFLLVKPRKSNQKKITEPIFKKVK